MRRLLLAGLLLAGVAQAEPIALYGTIGGKPVFLDLSHNGDTVSGWYFYLKAGKQQRLDGKLSPKGFFDIQEYTASDNSRSGSFRGRVRDGQWSGVWKNAAGKRAQPVAFAPIKGNLKDADGRYRCTARRKDTSIGFSLSHSLDLTLAKGRVKTLTLSRRVRSDGDPAQSCTLTVRDLKQVSAPVGIEMRARGDTPDGKQHCTLRIIGAGDYLLIRPGQASQAGDDCRAAGSSHFCTPDGFWSDLVVNRKTQSCKSVE